MRHWGQWPVESIPFASTDRRLLATCGASAHHLDVLYHSVRLVTCTRCIEALSPSERLRRILLDEGEDDDL